MKKVLFATTALVMTAGVAAAEVAVSGNARMGVVYDGTDWNFKGRVRIIFTASGETDGGLQFGASVRADHFNTDSWNGDGSTPATLTAGSVYISGAFGKIEMGDTDSAAEAAVGQVSGVGFTSLGSNNEISYIGGGASASSSGSYSDPAVLYTYSAGDLSFYLSLKDGVNGSGSTGQEAYGVAVAYSMGDYSVALGFESNRTDGTSVTNDGWYLGGSATFGAATVKAVIGDDDINDQQYALSVDYVTGALTVTAFYKDSDNQNTGNYGLGAAYDLGGGASVVGGVASVADGLTGSDTLADLGMKFTF